jgi:hypothetical protein
MWADSLFASVTLSKTMLETCITDRNTLLITTTPGLDPTIREHLTKLARKGETKRK